ncbi:MAG: hypothetical protein KYX69_09325 [Sphingomonas sp.]|uniref:hypothetical protein n=1 Tax=Sphingomonas sp. TaxID=28214 RepID=UPI002622864E|nr:hypothetical protein [Sphingomonas sp.]MDK2767906.1 hypothetical protein [Sphingomonas sp.]
MELRTHRSMLEPQHQIKDSMVDRQTKVGLTRAIMQPEARKLRLPLHRQQQGRQVERNHLQRIDSGSRQIAVQRNERLNAALIELNAAFRPLRNKKTYGNAEQCGKSRDDILRMPADRRRRVALASIGSGFALNLRFMLGNFNEVWGATRLSCRYCIFASLHDLSASAAAPANTEVYRELVGIEARSTFPFQPTRWLADIAPHLLSGGLRADVERAKADQLERRHLEASMPAGLRYVKGWPPRMPTLAEAEDIAAARRPILARHRLENRYPTGSAVQARFAELRVAAGWQKSA